MRIDFICIDSHGEYATGFRVYVNYRHIRGIKDINCEVLAGDILTIEGSYIRHDNMKLATAVFNYLMR